MNTGSRRLCALVLGATFLLVLKAPEAAAQHPPTGHPSSALGALESGMAARLGGGEGTIRGHLVHREGKTLEAGAEVTLYALSAEGNAGLRQTTSDAEGRFRFETVPNDATHVYLVSVRVGDIPYGARLVFAPGETESEIEIEILSPTLLPDTVEAGTASIRLQQGCTHLRVWHRHTLTNGAQRVAYIPPELRGDHEPFLQVNVGAGAESLIAPAGSGFEIEGGVARFWGPLFPGSQELKFGYGLPIEGDEIPLELSTSLGASRLELEVPNELGAPRESRLAAQDENAGLRRFLGPRLEPEENFRWRQPVLRKTQPAPLETPAARLWIEMDDAVLDVTEAHQLRLPVPLPESNLPLLCMELPEQARNPRLSTDSVQWGLTREPSGVLALHGPLPAGEPVISLEYDLPVQSDPLKFERRFALPLDRLEVVVADTGIVPRTERLHPLRPLHSGGRNYLRLEAFAIEPGEVISLEFARSELDAHSRGGLAALAAGVGALVAVGFLMVPLFGGHRLDEDSPEASELRSEREAIYRALDGLDEDLETGKISAADHEQLRGELRGRAVALLREEREPRAASPVATPCPGCGQLPRAGDLFCAQCGHALATISVPRVAEA